MAVTRSVSIFELIKSNTGHRVDGWHEGRAAGELDTCFLGLDRDERRALPPPRRDHAHRANATAQVEHGAGAWTPRRPVTIGVEKREASNARAI